MIESQYERAQKILSENKDKLTEIAKLLLEKEVIFKEDLVKVLGERPFKKEEPLASLEEKKKEENKEEE